LTQYATADAECAAPQLIVPAYFYPASHSSEWAWLAEHAAQIRLVVLNLANGPGRQADMVVSPAVKRIRAAGITVCGYVDTNYGLRPVDDVTADIHRHLDWYQVDGVFFDRAAIGVEQLSHYADLADRARRSGAQFVALNHGAHPIESYADHADLLGTFEGPWSAYLELAVPRWVRSRPAEQFFHLVYGVPVASFADARWLAAHRRASYAYVTDRTGDNPWDCLPADDFPRVPLSAARQGHPGKCRNELVCSKTWQARALMRGQARPDLAGFACCWPAFSCSRRAASRYG